VVRERRVRLEVESQRNISQTWAIIRVCPYFVFWWSPPLVWTQNLL